MNSTAYFDQISSNWDAIRKAFFPDSIRDQIIEKAQLEKDEIVVDLGAGSGFITEGLNQLPLSIIAIDQSAKMIEVMKTKFHNNPAISYLQTTADLVPLNDAHVDAVLANMYLHHTMDPAFVIQEVYRILKPGGRLILADLDEHRHAFLVEEQFDRWMGFDRSKIDQWMSAAGFIHVSVECSGSQCVSDAHSSAESADISIFIASGNKPD